MEFKKSVENDLLRNGGGYVDPTAYQALRKIEDEERERHRKLIGALLRICDLAGYDMVSHIIVRDRKTGRMWE